MAKLGLCIGINAYGHGNDLAGCVNDATDWAGYLRTRNFDEVTSLTDAQATRDNILSALRALTLRLKSRDVAVVSYSGHGTWVPDLSGDEADKRDEAWCPVDLWDHGVILDDELYAIFSRRPDGARLVVFSDSCYSGTVDRFLPPVRPPHSGAPAPAKARFMPPAAFLEGQPLRRAEQIGQVRDGRPRLSALTFTGCAEDQVSYDAWFQRNGKWRANGAFTQAALAAAGTLGAKARYRDWHAAITPRLLPSADYPQNPLLQGSWTQRRWRVA